MHVPLNAASIRIVYIDNAWLSQQIGRRGSSSHVQRLTVLIMAHNVGWLSSDAATAERIPGTQS